MHAFLVPCMQVSPPARPLALTAPNTTNMAQAAVSKRSAAPAASLTRPRTSPSLRRVSTVARCAPKSRARCTKAMAFLGVTSSGDIKQAERVKVGDTLPLDHEFM